MTQKLRDDIKKLLEIDDTEATTEQKIRQTIRAAAPTEEDAEGLIAWQEQHEFFSSPASTAFHGNVEGGLAEHSWAVTIQALKLAIPLFESFEASPEAQNFPLPTAGQIALAALAHDMCKAGLYEAGTRNVKDEDGTWKQKTVFTVRHDNRNLGHGNESALRLIEAAPAFAKDRMIIEAVSRHMGFSDVTQNEARNLGEILKNPLVLLIQTADQIASSWFNI